VIEIARRKALGACPLLMAGRAKVATLTGKSQKMFVTTFPASDPGKDGWKINHDILNITNDYN
jgi:hypothetical protein